MEKVIFEKKEVMFMYGDLQQYGGNVNGYYIPHTKKAIAEYISQMLGGNCRNIEWVDTFETVNCRHICYGTNIINILGKQIVNVPVKDGIIPVEVFFCPNCRTLIINSSTT